jgi:hypothetical protein
MLRDEAQSNIGKPFKYTLCHQWDTIRNVTLDGIIIGDFIECPCEDARLKQPIPEQLKKHKQDGTVNT